MVEPPMREVTNHDSCIDASPTDTIDEEPSQSATTPVCVISEDAQDMATDQTAEIPTDDLANNTANIFTHMLDPFKPARVEKSNAKSKSVMT